jgi:hypothetical protein
VNDGPSRDRLRLVSHFPGRLRVRARTFRAMPHVAGEVLARLREEPAVTGTEASPVTGSILVTYDPAALELPRLVQIIVVTGGLAGLEFDASNDWAARPPAGQRIRGALDRFNEHVREATGGRVDGRVALPAALATGSLALLFSRPRLPNWWDLGWWAYSTFHNMNPTQSGARVEGDGSSDQD